jgi:transcriptional regulator with XRE-family HTH domain
LSKSIAAAGGEAFGARLARLRKDAGYSQREMAAELGISHRVVAYYEGETQYPPAHLLPLLAKVLSVSTDELLGLATTRVRREPASRLWRRFKQVEALPAREKRQVALFIDALLEREKLRQRARVG